MPPAQSKKEAILEHLRMSVFPSIIAGDRYNLTVKTVERGRRNPQDLGNEDFPALFIVSTAEKTENIQQVEYESLMTVILIGYVRSKKTSPGSAMTGAQVESGKFQQDVRNALELDPLLGDRVKWLEITETTTDDGDIVPHAGFVMSARMEFVDWRSLP